MDVFMMIFSKNSTIFLNVEDSTPVLQLKKMITSIIKILPRNQQLYYKGDMMDENKILSDYGLYASDSWVLKPAVINLALRTDNGEFEHLVSIPYLSKIDLPQTIEIQEKNGHKKKKPHV